MSKAIRTTSQGVVIDANAIMRRFDMNHEERILYDPLMDHRRKTTLRQLIDAPAKKLNYNMSVVNAALKEMNEVMQHNQNLINKGADPNNPKDMSAFRRFDKSKLALLTGVFSTQ